MFAWLAKLLLNTQVQNTCSCCSQKCERLEKMRQQIERGQLSEEPEEHPQDNIIYCNTPEHEYTGKYLGSALYYNDIFVNGQKQNKE